MPEDPVRPDGFEFVKGGTSRCWVDGEQHLLRRPRHGEYKVLVILARERDDELADLREQATAASTWEGADALADDVLRELRAVVEAVELDGPEGPRPLDAEVKHALLTAADAKRPEPDAATAAHLIRVAREWGRRIADRQDELCALWLKAAFNGDGDKLKGLSDKSLPDDEDDWPPWLVRPEYTGQLIRHWGADPLAPGQQ